MRWTKLGSLQNSNAGHQPPKLKYLDRMFNPSAPVTSLSQIRRPGLGGASGTARSPATARCQKCLAVGHYTYECKGERVYAARESRSAVLQKRLSAQAKGQPTSLAKDVVAVAADSDEETPREGLAQRILERKERERKAANKSRSGTKKRRKRSPSVSSSSSSSSSSASSSSASSSSSSGSSDSDSSSSSDSDSSTSTSSTSSSSSASESAAAKKQAQIDSTLPRTPFIALQQYYDCTEMSYATSIASTVFQIASFNSSTATETITNSSLYDILENSSPSDIVCVDKVGPTFAPGTLDYEYLLAAWILTILFALASIAMTGYLILSHFRAYYRPSQQRWIVRILLMVPIYSVCSSLSFRFFWDSIYFNIARDFYEAFVIFSFFALLLQYLGKTPTDQHAFLQTISAPVRARYPPPLMCFTFNPRGHAFLVNTKICVLQYVVVRPVMTVTAYVLAYVGVLCPTRSGDPSYGQFWIGWINTVSVSVAMYALILFYVIIHHEIEEYDPLWKFIAVKFVVFFSFWQTIVINILDQNGVIRGTAIWSADNTSDLIDAFLVSLEMVLAAMIHLRAFPAREHAPARSLATAADDDAPAAASAHTEFTVSAAAWDVVNMADIWRDIVDAPRAVREVKAQRIARRAVNQSHHQHNLEDGDTSDSAPILPEAAAMGGRD
ncbi:hypothetical protein HDU82_002429 [Entophlyctis luteolus]|nr:hypothetical protein HDU82_002429 [Entophlyctis luteolus]